MWNVTILDKGLERDVIALQVEFSKDGEESIKINFTGRTVEEINNTIKNYKEALDKRDEEIAKLTVGEWAAPVVETAPEPTPEEIAQQTFEAEKAEWLKKKEVLSTMISDVEKGRVLGIEPDAAQVAIMTDLATWVNTNMKQEYYF